MSREFFCVKNTDDGPLEVCSLHPHVSPKQRPNVPPQASCKYEELAFPKNPSQALTLRTLLQLRRVSEFVGL